jgi:aldose 1-epimerase
MKITRDPYGRTQDNRQVDEITLINEHGYSCTLITLGARIISFKGPDKHGRVEELTKCPTDLKAMEDAVSYHGATIGRYANRIADGIAMIDGKKWELDENRDGCQLHGGPKGFSTVIWEAFAMREETRASVKFTHTSPDGDQGYPGTLDIAVTVTLTEENELFFLYEAVTDKPTVVSMTNHTYWNLSGNRKDRIYGHRIQIHADSIVETNAQQLPTGKILPVQDSDFDFRTPRTIGKEISGYDVCYIMPDRKGVLEAAEVYEPVSGRRMQVITDAPGIQFYTDNNDPQDRHGSLCLETQQLPEAFNHEGFFHTPLRPGDYYRQLTIHSFSVES